MTRLDELESRSIYIIREAHNRFDKIAVLWSIGKDSTTLLHLCKKAFYGKIPFPVMHIDTGSKFREIYEFRDKYSEEWGLDLVIAKNRKVKDVSPDKDRFECCNARKTEALKQVMKKDKFDALFLGIRSDEHGIRDKERYFSPRDKEFRWNVSKLKKEQDDGDSPYLSMQDAELSGWSLFATDFKDAEHVRVHPLLHWTERDVWKYVKREKLPVVSLYFAKNGKRYRSIGCEPCCKPVDSDADTIDKIIEELKTTTVEERSGRAQDKEHIMQKLRSLGYM